MVKLWFSLRYMLEKNRDQIYFKILDITRYEAFSYYLIKSYHFPLNIILIISERLAKIFMTITSVGATAAAHFSLQLQCDLEPEACRLSMLTSKPLQQPTASPWRRS